MITECHHTFVLGPFFLHAVHKYKAHALPGEYVTFTAEHRIEHCTQCGALRLPTELCAYESARIVEKAR